jgi:Spy/CpxP family protein refolding chaperone
MLPCTGKIIGRLALALLLCAGSVLAQWGGRRGGTAGSTVAIVVTEENTVDLFVVLLDLNDSQKQQLSAILDVATQTAGPIQEQLNRGKQSLFEVAKSGKSDSEINKVADQQGSLSSQMLGLQARSFAKVYSILTSDQQAKADSFLYERIGSLLASSIRPTRTH